LARDPLQLMARKLVCQGLTIATNGRHHCSHAPSEARGND
jgi:hypothetical protein